ncbi:MAG: hypothetical protein ABIF08_01365 [Nanoarchaeota archaeon]
MADKNLVKHIIKKLKEGKKIKEIKEALMQNAWSEKEIDETAKQILNKKKREEVKEAQKIKEVPKVRRPTDAKTILMIIIFIFSIAIIVLIISYSTPICGNGFIERGETPETCCKDTGCFGGGPCENNVCTEGICGECQYFSNNRCLNYKCCDDSACLGNQFCQDNKCLNIVCGNCQYIKDHQCLNYKCCDDSACDDGNDETLDVCNYGGTTKSHCANILEDKCNFHFDCDDGDDTTKDICVGTPRHCRNIVISECVNDDGFCPGGCNYTVDNNC